MKRKEVIKVIHVGVGVTGHLKPAGAGGYLFFVRALDMDREIQNERCRDRLEILRRLGDCILILNNEKQTSENVESIKKAREILLRSVDNSAPYTEIARAVGLKVF